MCLVGSGAMCFNGAGVWSRVVGVISLSCVHCCSMARHASSKAKPANLKTPPYLSHNVKQFILRVHPDRFGQHPELQTINQTSLATLNEFLQHIKAKV